MTLGYAPVVDAHVIAKVESDTHSLEILLRDGGIGADTMSDDGVYAGYFNQYNGDGKYRVKIIVNSVPGETKVIVGGLTGAYGPQYVLGSKLI